MALMRLTDDVNTVNFSPRSGYTRPQNRAVSIHTTLDGSIYTYKWFLKQRHEIPVYIDNTTDYEQLLTWWGDVTQLKFYYDLTNDPGTYYNVKILNDSEPLVLMYPFWYEKYEGSLLLREV